MTQRVKEEMGGFYTWKCSACQTVLVMQEMDAKHLDGAMTFMALDDIARTGLCHCGRVIHLDDLAIRKQTTFPRRM